MKVILPQAILCEPSQPKITSWLTVKMKQLRLDDTSFCRRSESNENDGEQRGILEAKGQGSRTNDTAVTCHPSLIRRAVWWYSFTKSMMSSLKNAKRILEEWLQPSD